MLFYRDTPCKRPRTIYDSAMKVRCIDDTVPGGSMSAWYGKLKNGQEYEVEEYISGYYSIDGVAWGKNRFVPVDSPTLKSVSDAVSSTPTPSKTKIDISEQKCWDALKPTIPAGYCVCGIHRSMCDYHRPVAQPTQQSPAPSYWPC
jgi:hypothetical protein